MAPKGCHISHNCTTGTCTIGVNPLDFAGWLLSTVLEYLYNYMDSYIDVLVLGRDLATGTLPVAE